MEHFYFYLVVAVATLVLAVSLERFSFYRRQNKWRKIANPPS